MSDAKDRSAQDLRQGVTQSPSPEQVLAVFHGERAGPAQVTDEIRRLAWFLELSPAERAANLKLSTDAYRGAQLLLGALGSYRPRLLAVLQAGPPGADDSDYLDYGKLSTLQSAIEVAVDTAFIREGMTGDPTDKQHGYIAIAAGVQNALEQCGAKGLGYSEDGPICRITAALINQLTDWGEVSPNAVSSALRKQLRRKPR